MKKFIMTAVGKVRLERELEKLKTNDRKNVIEAIAEARAHGDLSENAEYSAAKEKQGFIEGRIKEIRAKLSTAEVIDPKDLSGDIVKFSATVSVVDEETDIETTYQIVGEDESDLSAGKLYFHSPLARGLIGKSAGDSVEINTPKGKKYYEIIKVEYLE